MFIFFGKKYVSSFLKANHIKNFFLQFSFLFFLFKRKVCVLFLLFLMLKAQSMIYCLRKFLEFKRKSFPQFCQDNILSLLKVMDSNQNRSLLYFLVENWSPYPIFDRLIQWFSIFNAFQKVSVKD